MDDEARKSLYISLLQGLANEAQDRMCASDQQHAWSAWTRTELRHDRPFVFLTGAALETAMNEKIRYKSERHCMNCGRRQVA